jgi:hypothetical protein
MKFAYEPSVFLNSAVKYTVYFVYEDKPNIKINSPKELREFIETHAEYDIVGLTPHGFYEMELDIARRESEDTK